MSTTTYWQEFGFRQPPFEETMQYAMYYPIAGRQQLLDYLGTIDHTRDPLVAILGVLGSGKSMLAAQFFAQQDGQFITKQLLANNSLRPQNLLAEIANAFAIKENVSSLELNDQLDAIMTHLQQRHQTHVLVIDDAHRLPLETLSTIISLADIQHTDGRPVLYLLLLAEPQLQQRLENLLDVSDIELRGVYFDLPALSFDETKAYLKHRTQKAGLTTEKPPFDDAALHRIHDLSAGIPGRINRVARQALLDDTRRDRQPMLKATEKSSAKAAAGFLAGNQIKIISLALLVLVGYVLWQYQNKIDRALYTNRVVAKQSQDVAQPQQTAIVNNRSTVNSVAPQQVATNVNNTAKPSVKQQTQSPRLLAQNQTASAVSDQPASESPMAQTTHQTQSAEPLERGLTLAMQQLQNHASQADLAKAAAQSTDQPATTASRASDNVQAVSSVNAKAVTNTSQPQTAATQATLPTASDNDQLAKMQQQLLGMHGYSLQLLGRHDLADVQKFIKQHGLQNKVLILVTTFQNRPWYTVIYGQYSSPAAAKQAVADMPTRLQAQRPWVRGFASIHQAIRQQG